MELTVFRQATKDRGNGVIVYKGEDGRPYADDKLIMITDGLGGAAAIHHRSFDLGMFDSEKLLDTLFKGVYDEYSDERFVKYVKDSFFELRAVKDCYMDNSRNMKKSGYFASRIVSAIMLHELYYNDSLQPANIIGLYNNLETPEEKESALKQLGEYFAATIKEYLGKIAKKANFIYESSFSGLALLGTTLCATLFHENEDSVEAIYLSAGDSLPYLWNEQEGLCQILKDEERDDGGMTNFIKANEGADFHIRCDYRKFTKPCILFNASDGCFDSFGFISPMAFEKLILETAVASNDPQSMGAALELAFKTLGRHDDSSTIAMKMFGFASFDELKNSAARRLEAINEKYLSKMPDLLEKDYRNDPEESDEKTVDSAAELKTMFEEQHDVLDQCAAQLYDGMHKPYQQRLADIDRRASEKAQELEKHIEAAEQIAARNYTVFSDHNEHRETWADKLTSSQLRGIVKQHEKTAEDYTHLVDQCRADVAKTTDLLKNTIDKICEIGVPAGFSDFDKVGVETMNECERSMDLLFGFIKGIKTKKQNEVAKLSQLRNDYVDKNVKLAENNKDDLLKIRDALISGEITAETLSGGILPEDKDALNAELTAIREMRKWLNEDIKNERVKAFQESRKEYWDQNYLAVIEAVANDPGNRLDAALREKAMAFLAERKKEQTETVDKASLQAELFRLYDETYYKYMEASD